jgi:hypothetical protein
MNQKINSLPIILLVCLLGIALVGSLSKTASAQPVSPIILNVTSTPRPTITLTRLPTEMGHDRPTPTPFPADGGLINMINQPTISGGQIDYNYSWILAKKYSASWGGVNASAALNANNAELRVYQVPVRYMPGRAQLVFFRAGMEIQQYSNGGLIVSPPPLPLNVYFDLVRAERATFDKSEDAISIYWFNPTTKGWETCPDVVLDASIGSFGRLTCKSSQWGYYALSRSAH